MRRKRNFKSAAVIISIVFLVFSISCDDFFDPKQELNLDEKNMFTDWYEYRAAGMGLYGLQQKLVEQLLVLGELRGDLLKVTENADADLKEIYEFKISKTNKYASPINFFKLIGACNNLIRVIEKNHPEVLDRNSSVTNYDRLYGEAVTMRAWAYFNAVRIYGKVPFIHQSLVTDEEIEKYINSSGTYVDSIYITYALDGYHNDTIKRKDTTLTKLYYDLNIIVDKFTNELENLKAVGVNYAINNNKDEWEIITWHDYGYHALLGHMYLTIGDLVKAAYHFNKIIFNNSDNDRYELNSSFSYNSWSNIFRNIDNREHIYTIFFNKGDFQQNNLQKYFYPEYGPNKFLLKPTKQAILKWETVWRNQQMAENFTNPSLTRMTNVGNPGDYFRGYGISYIYFNGIDALSAMDFLNMLDLKKRGDMRNAENILAGYDTVVWKYSLRSYGDAFQQDPYYIIYRAAGIHLYLAEIYTYWAYEQNGLIRTNLNNALYLLNDGKIYDISQARSQRGVRGRVGLGGDNDAININNIIYLHDPFTNKIIGYKDYSGKTYEKQLYLEEQILDERARELAFEGERFYDLMRVAKRRNDPTFLAKKVSEKFEGTKRDEIYNFLKNENNWYIHYFE